MRDALKSLFTHQIILEDGSHFYYTIKPFELTNALGNVIAVLQEYTFIKRVMITDNFPANYTRQKRGVGMILKKRILPVIILL
jgi:hypothetical protein